MPVTKTEISVEEPIEQGAINMKIINKRIAQ